MAYQALYRRFRPRTFDDVLGQDHITRVLKSQIESGHVTHAYLFVGTRGTGKTTAARLLARAVNCLSPVNGSPCGVCDACKVSFMESCADIVELDAASNSRADDMRSLLDKAHFTPLELRKKVYIIDEAHALSSQAFNTLLKTLEEPPPHLMFILATTEPHKLPATIISRCQRFDFHRISMKDMLFCLKNALSGSNAQIDDEGLMLIARAANGGMRDALSLADQCISFVGHSVTKEDVYAILGAMDAGFIFEMADALIESDAAKALTLLDGVVRDGRDLRVFAGDLASHMRALLLAKLCGSCSSLLDCTEETMERYIAQAKTCSQTRLLCAVEMLMSTQQDMGRTPLPRVLLESTLVRISQPEIKVQLDSIMQRLEKLEKLVEQGVTVTSRESRNNGDSVPADVKDMDAPPWSTADKPETVKKPKKTAPPVTPALSVSAPVQDNNACVSDAQSIWDAVKLKLKADYMTLYVMAISNTSLHLDDSNTLTVGFDKNAFCTALNAPQNKQTLDAVMESCAPGVNLRIVFSKDNSLEKRARELFGDDIETID